MSRIAFADESGTHGNSRCYAIGVVSVAENRVARFDETFARLKLKHGVANEVHWKKVDRGHGLINLAIDWLWRILGSSTARFDVIVVNTAQYRKWHDRSVARETAFYVTYTHLLRHLAKQVKETTRVLIDDRSDEYNKQDEVLETIGNRMLSQLESKGRLASVTKHRSHDYPGIQVADLLTGAIATSHRLLLDPTLEVNDGKRLAIARLAATLGWDALHYDTFPDSRFNIWHFPEEFRATPATKLVRRSRLIQFIQPEELTHSLKTRSSA